MGEILEAEQRKLTTVGDIRALRRQGKVPAILYGAQEDSLPIMLYNKALHKKLETGKFFSTVYDLKLKGGKEEKVLVRDIQFHPASGDILHIDLMRLNQKTEITVEIPVHFLNQEICRGLKMGGVLNIVRHTIEVWSLPNSIPDMIKIDLAEAEIGDSLHISQTQLPEGVRPTIEDRDFTIATIAAVRATIESDEEEGDEEGNEEEGETEEK